MSKTAITNEEILKDKEYKTPIDNTTMLINQQYSEHLEDL